MSDRLVSVIIPTHNRAYCICRAIDSVRDQSHQNWEAIVVDDGSTDETGAVIASKYGHDSRVRYIYQNNAGVSAARNTGIRASQGQFVAFLDSDDIWKPWKLQTQLACFRAFPDIGMVWTEFEAMDPTGKIVSPKYLKKMYHAYRFFQTPASLFSDCRRLSTIIETQAYIEPDATAYIGDIYTAMLRGNLVHTSTVVLSRERIEKVKGFDESLVLAGEDYDFHFRTCKWGNVCFVDTASTIYQLDFRDRLTRHKLHLAMNFLKTVQAAIASENGNVQFPPAMVNEVLAQAYAWIAEEQFRTMDRAGIRRHAWMSLRYRLWQPRRMCLLGLSILPRTITHSLLRAYRNLK